MKTTVVLKNLQPMPHTPQAINGQSGIVYGHALFDPAYNAHVFRMPYEEWAGDKGIDICKRASGPLNRYHVLFEHEDDGAPSTREKDLAAQLQASQLDLQAARREIDRLDRASVVQSYEPADRRITETDKLELATQDSQSARENFNAAHPAVPVAVAEDGAPLGTKPPTSLDEANAGFLAAAKNGMPLTEKRVEENPETGATELVEREATPVVSGVPSAPAGETPVSDFVNVHETRTPLEAADEKSPLVAAAEDADTTPVHDEPAPVVVKESAQDAPAEATANSDLDPIADDFRALREVAKTEGVPDIEKITKPEDMRAAIELHRESKDSGDAAPVGDPAAT